MALSVPLKNLAKTIRNVATKIAPRDTGRLRNALRAYNTPERMVKSISKDKSKITFFVAPPQAKYGEFWNEPPVPKSKQRKSLKKNNLQHWNYGDKALKSPEVKRAIKDYTKALGKSIAADLKKTVRLSLGEVKPV